MCFSLSCCFSRFTPKQHTSRGHQCGQAILIVSICEPISESSKYRQNVLIFFPFHAISFSCHTAIYLNYECGMAVLRHSFKSRARDKWYEAENDGWVESIRMKKSSNWFMVSWIIWSDWEGESGAVWRRKDCWMRSTRSASCRMSGGVPNRQILSRKRKSKSISIDRNTL